jgi:hypothetical protein
MVTKVDFGPGKAHGVSLALMMRSRLPGLKVLFIARPEFKEHTIGIGEFIATPISASDLLATVDRIIARPAVDTPA